MLTGRRTFLVILGGLGAAGGVGFGALRLRTGTRRRASAAVAAWLGDSTPVSALGIEYLTRHPEEGDAGRLQSRLSLGLAALAAVGARERVALRLDEAIRRDFDAGRVEWFGGWILSVTELRLCALVALTSSASSSGMVGVFAPEALPDGARVRWTAPTARFTVPASMRRLELPVRSGAPFPQRVAVHYEGKPVDEVTVGGPLWHPLRYGLLDKVATSGPAELELRVAPVWRPADDFRTIGIGLGEAPWLEGAAAG